MNTLENDKPAIRIAPVSVVIPCYRCATTIARSIASLCYQTLKPTEVILVEDASGDDTLLVLQKLATQYPDWIRVIALPDNQGAASARNVGWNNATQPYIAFLDADDAWHPEKIEIQYKFMQQHPELVLTGHGFRLIAQSDVYPDWVITPTWCVIRTSKFKLLLSNQFITPSVMLRRSLNQRFYEKKRYMEDHLLWLDILYHGGAIAKLSIELAAIYKPAFGVTGLSSHLWAMEKGELHNYYYLYRASDINVFEWLLLNVYSILKYIRRLFIYGIYLRWKK